MVLLTNSSTWSLSSCSSASCACGCRGCRSKARLENSNLGSERRSGLGRISGGSGGLCVGLDGLC